MKSEASTILSGIRAELAQILERFRNHTNYQRLQNDFDRWKGRAVEKISEGVSRTEGEKLEALRNHPSWIGQDTFDSIILEHVNYLDSLVADVAERPEEYGPRLVESQRKQQARAERLMRRETNSRQSTGLRDVLQNHPLVIIFTVAIAAFGAGFASYGAIQEAGGWERISRYQLDSLHAAASQREAPEGDETENTPSLIDLPDSASTETPPGAPHD